MAAVRNLVKPVLAPGFPKPKYRKIEKKAVTIPMRDGVKLSAIVMKPKDLESCPVIFTRNPYASVKLAYELLLPIFAEQGYAGILIDVRGTGKSEGEWSPLAHETEDGYDCIDWINEQSWCNGNIGGFGASYLGYTQWSVIDCPNPALKALFTHVSGGDLYNTFWRRGMFRMTPWTPWSVQEMGENRFKFMVSGAPIKNSYSVQPASTLDEATLGEPCNWYKELISHPFENDPHWQKGYWSLLDRGVSNAKVPILVQASWFDALSRPSFSAWRALPENIRKESRFFIGPWDHSGMNVGAFKHKNASHTGLLFMKNALDWYDFRLKGEAYPETLGTVEAYEVRAGKYVEFEGDLPSSDTLKLYLDKDASLSEKAGKSQQKQSYTYDPKNPFESYYGNALRVEANNAGWGPQVMKKPGDRDDVLSFISGKVGKGQAICGSIKADLYVSSDCPATAFTITVAEVGKDGKTYNIRDDITDIRYVTETEIQDYTPGEVRHLEIELLDIYWKLQKGSRIRVDISSSNYPMYHIHPNNTELWGEQVPETVAHQTIYFGGKTPSGITIPLQ